MTKAEIIELANVNTERKYERLNVLPQVFASVLQDFCSRSRYWWRKMSVSFNTVQGQQTYDLTSVTTTPALTEITVEEITVLSLVQASMNPPVRELTPVFDDEAVNELMEAQNPNGTTVPVCPSRYTFSPNDYKTILIDVPDGVYKLRAALWAMPNPQTDSTTTVVPLVPPQFHRVIVSGMEAYIWKRIYGPEDQKTLTASQDYENGIILAQARPRFSTNVSQQLVSNEHAIRSTH